MKHKQLSIQIIKMAWLLVCFLIGFSFFNKGHFTGEYTASFLAMMTLVTFPSGYVAIYLIRAMFWILPAAVNDHMAGSYALALSLWVLMTILGYFQWFYLIPRILAKIKLSKSH